MEIFSSPDTFQTREVFGGIIMTNLRDDLGFFLEKLFPMGLVWERGGEAYPPWSHASTVPSS